MKHKKICYYEFLVLQDDKPEHDRTKSVVIKCKRLTTAVRRFLKWWDEFGEDEWEVDYEVGIWDKNKKGIKPYAYMSLYEIPELKGIVNH